MNKLDITTEGKVGRRTRGRLARERGEGRIGRLAARGAIWLAAAALLQAASSPGESLAMFRGNPEHTGVYEGAGVKSFSRIKWSFHMTGQVIASPAVANGVVFAGSTGGNFYAVDGETGKVKWTFDAKSRTASSAAVAEGMVYFGAYDGSFYGVDAETGLLKWKFKTGGERRFAATHLHGSQPATETMPDPWDCYLSSPVVWRGAVYFGSGDGNVYALDAASGALKWKFKTGDVVHASPAIAGGTLFVGSWDTYFYALDAATGGEKWRFKTGEDPDIHNQTGIQSSAAVADGVVYFGCRDAHLYALDAQTGEKRWAYPTKGSWVITSPAVSKGTVYFATSDSGLLHAVDAKTGSDRYTVGLQGWPTFASPAIAGEMLYTASTSGKVSAVDLGSQKIAWTFATDSSQLNGPKFSKPDGSPDYATVFASDFYDDIMAGYRKLQSVGSILSSPVVAGNVVYFGGTDGNLYALM